MDKWNKNGNELFPNWMNMIMIICKLLICIMPFIICSLLMMFSFEFNLRIDLLITCVYLLSLSSIVNNID